MEKYIKDFDEWNLEKQKIHYKKDGKKFWFEEREVWWCSFGVNIGVEIDGKTKNFNRPALIVRVFNKGGLYVLPITTKRKDDKFHFLLKDFSERQKDFNSVVLTQLKFISSKRLLRKIDVVSKNEFSQIKERVKCFI